jgi:serine/threonine-protein phosphatase 4 catalytic subunit
MNNDGFNSEIDKYIETLEKCEYIKEKEVKLLCDKAKEQLSKEENVIYLDAPITVNKIFLNLFKKI